MFLSSIALIWWNEGNAVKKHKALDEGQLIITPTSSYKIDSKNEGQLIHLSGDILSNEPIEDYDYKIKTNGLKLNRKVEKFELDKDTDSNDKKDSLLGHKDKKWVEQEYIYSESPEDGQKEYLSDMKWYSSARQVETATINSYTLSQSLLDDLNNFVPVDLSEVSTSDFNFKIVDNYIYIGNTSLNKPEIGDFRVSFEEVKEGEYSIISGQYGNSFKPYITDNKGEINLIEPGNLSSTEMFDKAHSYTSNLLWVFRILGIILMFFGAKKCFNPLIVLSEFIPILNKILNFGVNIFSGVIAFFTSIIVIAIAWIIERPIYSSIIIGSIVALTLIIQSMKSSQRKF